LSNRDIITPSFTQKRFSGTVGSE